MHLIDLIEKELQAYRKPGGQSISRTARALDEARSMVGAQTKAAPRCTARIKFGHVGTAIVSVTLFRQSVTWSMH
jgi:hypothetical protein